MIGVVNMKLNTLTDKGMSRSENQDNYWSAIANVNNAECCIACICDGMGGLNNGKEASRVVSQRVRDYSVSNFDFSGLSDVIREANKWLYSLGGNSKETMMGTTCSILYAGEGVYKILHVGDSRVYKLHNGEPTQITEDHSAVVALKIDRVKEPDKWLKYRSKLTRCVGARESVNMSYYEGTYSEGDVFVLCSDGVWHLFDSEPLSAESIADLNSLFDRCMSRGETDNLTAIALYT